jgi:hypothetical protein
MIQAGVVTPAPSILYQGDLPVARDVASGRLWRGEFVPHDCSISVPIPQLGLRLMGHPAEVWLLESDPAGRI